MAGGPAPALDPSGADSWRLIPANRRVLAGAALALSNFMVVLDLTIANVSVPHISGDIGISLDQGTWIITSYAVAEAVCVPLTGWLAQRFGAVRVFILSVIGFGLFSVLCGFSTTLGMIVAFRIGQGLCGGPILPMSQTLMVRVFPPEKRAIAMAIWAMTVTAGPALGPLLGGYISDNLSWHWIFFINLPVALLCMATSYAVLRPVETPTRTVPIDKVGLGLLVLWIACVQIMLDIGRDRDWFADPTILALGISGALGFVVFVIWELTDEHPVVDLRVFRYRGFWTAVLAQCIAFGAFFAGVVVVPQWLQTTLGYSAAKSGLVSGAHAFVAMALARPVAGLLTRVDARALVCFGMLCMAASAWLRSGWTSDAPMSWLLITMMSQGVGASFMMIPLTTISLSAVKPHETATAAGLQNFARTVSLAIGTSMVLTIWSNAQITAHAGLVGRLHEQPVRAVLSGLGLGTLQSSMFIDQVLQKEAVTLAINHVFHVAVVMNLVAAAVIWLSPKPALAPRG